MMSWQKQKCLCPGLSIVLLSTYQLAPFKRSEKVCKEGETNMCSAKWSNIDGALPQTKSPHLEAQNKEPN